MNIISHIILRGLTLNIHLGWPDAERVQTQTVMLDINLGFDKAPAACQTDNIEHTYCYDTLVTTLQKKFSTKEFRLLEHFTHEMYQAIRQTVTPTTKISVRVKKMPPNPSLHLTEGVTFYYGDETNGW